MPEPADLLGLAAAYLERQGWYLKATGDLPRGRLELDGIEVLRRGPPGLVRLTLARPGRRFHLLVGWRPSRQAAAVLHNEEQALLGAVNDGGEDLIVYDALRDDELALALLGVVTNGAESAERVRHVVSLVSHASLVYDERLFMKCYRVLDEGPRPEVEVLFRLDAVGFNALLAPVARWQKDGTDLALVREFLPGALEGRLLALTSLRDLLAHAADREPEEAFSALPDFSDIASAPGLAGGDFAAEMARLGGTTAHLHLALAAVFGEEPYSPEALAGALGGLPAGPEGGDGRFEAPGEGPEGIAAGLLAMPAGGAGRSIQLHGDYHLRRVLRAELGWLVAGFGDDPLYGEEAPKPSAALRRGSPLEDVADMSFSLGRLAAEALEQRPPAESELAGALAGAWWRRNRDAFVRGYVEVPGIEALIPAEAAPRELVLRGLELVRQRRYEATLAEG